MHREVDLAVRMAPPQQDVLLATRVRDVELGLHAHDSYLARHGKPASLAELTQHALIGFDVETQFLREARKHLPLWTRENFAFRCDSDLGQLALIRSGAGIGVCQVALAQADQRLTRVLSKAVAVKLPTWIVMHADLRSSRRCKVVYEALVKGLRRA